MNTADLRMPLAVLVLAAVPALLAAAGGDTRMAEAAMRGDRAAVRALIASAADVNGAQGDGMTALHWAAYNDDVEMARMLVVAGANLRAATRVNSIILKRCWSTARQPRDHGLEDGSGTHARSPC